MDDSHVKLNSTQKLKIQSFVQEKHQNLQIA